MKNTILLIAVLLLAVAVHNLYSQPYYARHYQVENGLSNNAVVCALQDKKGFLWFGTKDGLNRFDGYTFKVFRHNPDEGGSIGNNFIHSLYEDRHEILWVGTEGGLYRYNPTTESFHLLPAADNRPVRDIQMDGTGNLWFISGFTLIRYNEAKNHLRYYNTAGPQEFTSVCTTADGTLWASTSTGRLGKYDTARKAFTFFDVFRHSTKPVSRWIEKIYATDNGSILIGTSNQGAKLFDLHTLGYKDILTYNPDKTEIFARNFVQTSAGEYWIATETGIFIYNTASGTVANLRKKYNDTYSITDNAVYAFVKDKEGGIWAGTYFGGINYYPRPFTPFKKFFPQAGENSLSGNVVREIHEDRYGRLWIGTEDAGLNRYDTATGIFTHFQPTGSRESISYTNIHGLLVNGNELWVGTFEHGLDILDIRTGKVTRRYRAGSGPNSLNSNFIYTIYRAGTGEILLGTTRGAYRYNGEKKGFSVLPGMPLNNWYTSLLKDHKDITWAGTYGNGAHYFDARTGKNGNFRYDPLNRNSLASDRVNNIFEDSRHRLWFATEGGLCLYVPGVNGFTRFTVQNGFPSNFILSLLEDESGNLWISTSKGLVCFDPQTEQSKVYTTANGTLNDQFNFKSAFKDKAGNMYFGSVKGMIGFRPAGFVKNTFVPPVYLTGFQVFNEELSIRRKGSPLNKSITYTRKIILPYNKSTFSIDFAALGYTAPRKLEYAYKMEGLDKAWTHLKTNRKAYFTELSPGAYTFKVKASNSNGMWNGREANLVIKILPPWWASPWAYGLYFLAGVLLVSYIVLYYHHRTEEKNRRKIELLQTEKEKEVFQAKIEFFTNVAHEIKTPLTLIKGPLEKVMKKAEALPEIKNSLKIIDKNTNRLIDLANQFLDFRQTEIKEFSLNFVRANISELLEETYTSFKPLAEQKNLNFILSLPPAPLYASVDVEAFHKIISNLFSNAVKYSGGNVEVRLIPEETINRFTIDVMNDGFLIPGDMKEKIFEPFFRLKETSGKQGTGIGLVISRSLAQLHKGVLEWKEPEKEMNVFSLTLPIDQE